MGIKERHGREREAVARAILDAARDLFVTEGYQNVSIRKIAERIEYSPAAIYGYFESKDDIFFALAEEGFRILSECNIEAASERLADPLETLRCAVWRYYEFSKTHPEYFALMFVDRSVPRISRDYERFAFVHELKGRLTQLIQTCIDSGALPASLDPRAAFRILSIGVYGTAVMRLADRLGPDENSDALARDVLETTIAGLRSGVQLTYTAGACGPAEAVSVPEQLDATDAGPARSTR